METRQRWLLPLLTWVPYTLLAVGVAFTVAVKHATPGSLLIDLVLCAVIFAWLLGMITLHPGWRGRRRVMAVFLGGLIAFTAVLVLRDPWFGIFTPACYLFAFDLPPWPWKLIPIGAVAVVAGTAQSAGIARTTALGVISYLAVLVINVLPMCCLAWLLRAQDRHSTERERVLTELGEANRHLEAALAENDGLHRQLLAQAREAGVVDERRRMAREIHDTLAQGLAGIITQLQAAEHAEHDPAAWRRHLAAATGLARESLTEARRSVHELRPEPLDTARLAEALAEVAARWSTLYGIPVQVSTTGTVRPTPPEAELTLLRAAQEALANVAKHAAASRVGLTLSYLEDEVALDVRDDGCGFATPAAPDDGPGFPSPTGSPSAGGFGLIAMRQRIEALAGTLQIESEPGAGTAISAHIPLSAGSFG